MSASPTSKFSALYYPYSRCVDAEALKLLAILYEEIVFVDPLEDVFREFLLGSDKGCQHVPLSVRQRWNQNRADWDLLRDRGVLRVIDPTSVIREQDALLSAAYASDMADDNFMNVAMRSDRTTYTAHSRDVVVVARAPSPKERRPTSNAPASWCALDAAGSYTQQRGLDDRSRRAVEAPGTDATPPFRLAVSIWLRR